MGRMVRDKKDDLLKDELKTIDKPCLLIWGREDQVVPLNIGERLASDLPQSKLVILDQVQVIFYRRKIQKQSLN